MQKSTPKVLEGLLGLRYSSVRPFLNEVTKATLIVLEAVELIFYSKELVSCLEDSGNPGSTTDLNFFSSMEKALRHLATCNYCLIE